MALAQSLEEASDDADVPSPSSSLQAVERSQLRGCGDAWFPVILHVVGDHVLREVDAVRVVLLDPFPYLNACPESLALFTLEALPRETVESVLFP